MEGYIAQIMMFAGTFAPKGWAYCEGQIISIAQNSALFSLLGTTYGGNGTTTFALPDFRGRVAVGTGNGPGLSPRTLGEVAGTESVTLLAGQIPAHIHPATATAAVSVTNATANTEEASGSFLTETAAPFYASAGASAGNLGGVTASVTVGPNAGGGQPVQILPPYLAMNYVICMQGIFPSRN